MKDEYQYETYLERDMRLMYSNQFYALHPFSRDCEGIWEDNVWMWFTHDEYSQAQDDV